jgi:hypothetical protein
MKTFKQLQEEISARRIAELKAKGKGDAVKAQMKSDGTKVAPHQGTKEKQKRLPPPAGKLALRPADKGRDIVKQKSSALATTPKPGALATTRPNKPGDNSNKMGRVPKPYRSGPDRPEPTKPNKKPGGPDLGKMARGALGNAWNAVKKAKTTQKGQPMSRGGGISAPKRGVYNG